MASAPRENHELALAMEFVQHTGRHIFLTGKAGTGKTTFLHSLKGNTAKRMIITAPTGVAAINAGGVTLHSFFQLPFGPFIPGSEAYEKNRKRIFRFSKEKIRIIKSLDLLVIDEISMVRADLLDSVDAVLRRHRRNNQPFGGVQLLMIGDLHQLSPVAKKEEWQLLEQYYTSVYFFSSHALAETRFSTIELIHIYRQSDPRFIELLNQIRDNRLDDVAVGELNKRHIRDFTPKEDQGFITLTTHNRNADSLNKTRLAALDGKKFGFDARVTGDFPEHTFPTPGNLMLKKGAQVMFLRNDSSPEKRYYNGKIGKVTALSSQEIHITCPGESEDIVVEPVEWENIKYTVNEENKEINEDIIGRFKQFPLKLAWAITIHKSQGLTFEKAVIDAGAAFTHGQVYVALSRCKTLEGMVLTSPVPSRGLEADEAVLEFSETERQDPPGENKLWDEKIFYQQALLLECFDFQLLHNRFTYLMRLLMGNKRVLHISGASDFDGLKKAAGKDIFSVSEKFKHQLRTLFTTKVLPESDPHILERIRKASGWFQDKFSVSFDDTAQKLAVETDNKELGKKINNALNNFKQEFMIKRAGIHSCEEGFSPRHYLRSISGAALDFVPEKKQKSKDPVFSESDIEHPELFLALKDFRSRKAKELNIAHFQILHQRVLIQIVVRLPDNKTDLKKISGVGRKTIEKYGDDILELVVAYRKKHGIETVLLPEIKKTSPKETSPINTGVSDTRQASFDLFNKGFAIPDIAKERVLVESTIQEHLCFFVQKGELDINKLLPAEKQTAIKAVLVKMPGNLKAAKDTLGRKYSYGDLKLMMAHLKFMVSKKMGTIRGGNQS